MAGRGLMMVWPRRRRGVAVADGAMRLVGHCREGEDDGAGGVGLAVGGGEGEPSLEFGVFEYQARGRSVGSD